MEPQPGGDRAQIRQVVQRAVRVSALVAPGVMAERTIELDHQCVRHVLDVAALAACDRHPL
ncbi:hypothetical protein WBG06_11290 [Nocardioides sp. CCNWLW239]|uniref:hypothetical protein n=1 Tax=Nocardioides sp. CCNWLW239 TaxID=3128902 RepID=UPI003019900C